MTKRVLFVFAWLVVGGEETELRLLAKNLDPARYKIEAVACFRKENMPLQTHYQLEAMGVAVDTAPYWLSFEDTVRHLAAKIPNYDIVVACQAVRDVYPTYDLIEPSQRPPLIEHGGLVEEALAGPKHYTTRYVGVCRSIRDAAASQMPGRDADALEIPSMVDLSEFDASHRAGARSELGIPDDVPLVGWVGRLDRKKRVEDFLRAAAHVHQTHPEARFVVIGGPDAFMPEYADELHHLAATLGVSSHLTFLGDRPDVPRLLSGLDVFCWLSRGEGMPHVIGEAGAAYLPVVATRDNGSEQQILENVTGLFVPHEDPESVAKAVCRLIEDPVLRRTLGENLRTKVEKEYSAQAVARAWERLFDTLRIRE